MRRALLIMGATATGKSRLALELAERTGREIISADSRQVFKGIRIGSAQPSSEERARVAHHLIDFLPLDARWSAKDFAESALTLLRRDGRPTALVVGGTGFYLESLSEGFFPLELDEGDRERLRQELEPLPTEELAARLAELDPVSTVRIHERDRQRILRALEVTLLSEKPFSEHLGEQRDKPLDIRWMRVLFQVKRELLHSRIEARLDAMLAGGWIEEVEALLAGGADPVSPGMKTLGYPEIVAYLGGDLDRQSMRERILVRTRQYARRQEIWFRRRCPADLVLDPDADDAAAALLAMLGNSRNA
jgi:tRNA dimethylallyltransferase